MENDEAPCGVLGIGPVDWSDRLNADALFNIVLAHAFQAGIA